MGYKVNKSEKPRRQLQALSADFDRTSELSRAIGWYLERIPRVHAVHIQDNFYHWVTQQLAHGFPLLEIHYKIDDAARTVTIISISRVNTNLPPAPYIHE